ncbi:MAG: DUF4129 domain-containing protein [Solobacterium sp.]|nr:DUF4129 domain-containing protein [Solobacterium sp.]
MIGLIYDFTEVLVLALTAVLSAVSVGNGQEILPVHYLVTLFCTAVTVFPIHLKARGRTILAGVTAALVVGNVLSVSPGERMDFLRNSVWVLWVLFGCILCVLFERLVKNNRKLRIIPAASGVIVLVFCLIRGIRIEKMPVLMILLLIILMIVELLQEGWQKEGDTDTQAHVVYLLPFILLLFLMIFGMNGSEEPYNWKFVKDLARNAQYRFEMIMESLDLKKGWDEREAEVGFSEEAEFFGNISSSPYTIFQITTGTPVGTGIYLAGKSFDTFDGRKWIKQDDSDMDYRMYDVLETTGAVLSYDPEHVQDYIRNGLMNVDIKSLKTVHVFAPTKYVPVLRYHEVNQVGGDLCFPKKQRNQYSIDFIRLNREYEKFEDLLKTAGSNNSEMNEEILSKAAEQIPGSNSFEYTVEGLQEYRKRIYEVYGQKPAISKEMNAFLEEALAGTESSYEKLQRIESILSKMEYTKQPGELPSEVNSASDFLDYLVLKTQRGYCTHFATAFVLLARTEGIPARYVQGYSFPVSSGMTTVMSDQAHAWPEAYLKGIGWIVFEPTPGSRTISGWNVSDGTGDDEKEVYNPYEHYADKKENSSETEGPKESVETKNPVKKISEKLYIPFMLAVLFLLFFIPVDLLIRSIQYRKLSKRDKAVHLFGRCLKVLKRFGLQPENGETLSEFAVRAEGTVPELDHSIIGIYEDIIYGDRPVSDTDLKQFEAEYRNLLKLWFRSWKKKVPPEPSDSE